VRDLAQTLDSFSVLTSASELWIRSLPSDELEYNCKWRLRNADGPETNSGLLRNDTTRYMSLYELFAQSNFRVWLVLVIISTGIGIKFILNKGLSIGGMFQ